MSVVEQPKSAGLIARVQGMLMKPAVEWDVIDGESATVPGLFTGYACILAAIIPIMSALAGILAFSALGALHSIVPFAAHLGPVAVIGGAVVSYVSALLTTFAVGFIIDALAPSFDGQRSQIQGMKLAVYSWTAVWVSGIALIIPLLGGLVVIAALFYSLYAFWIGAPKLMKVPAEKASGYALVCMLASLVAGAVIWWVLHAVEGMFFVGSMMTGGL